MQSGPRQWTATVSEKFTRVEQLKARQQHKNSLSGLYKLLYLLCSLCTCMVVMHSCASALFVCVECFHCSADGFIIVNLTAGGHKTNSPSVIIKASQPQQLDTAIKGALQRLLQTCASVEGVYSAEVKVLVL